MTDGLCSLVSPLSFLADSHLLYIVALLSVGLLPVKKLGAYAALSLTMASVWAGTAALSCQAPRPDPLWTWLAAVETALFLLGVAGALMGKIRFEARSGRWTIVGTAFLVYSLLIFPLLSQVLKLPQFANPVNGPLFSPVLFTCGLLFFVLQPWVQVALAPLIVSALLGGPGEPSFAETVGLHVALVTGCLFCVLPRELRGGSDGRSVQANTYRLGYRYRAPFSYLLWTMILATIYLYFGGQTSPRFLLNLALLCGLGIVLWLLFPAWQSRWYRYVAWCLAQCGGWLWIRFKGSLRWIVLLLGAAALFIVATKAAEPADRSPWLEMVQKAGHRPFDLFLAALLAWVIYSVYRARRRLVIGDVTAHIGDGKEAQAEKSQWVAGLGPYLQNKLARIADLYRVIDEARPSQSSNVIEVTPEVKEVGQILADASAIDFGPVKIPTKIFVSLLGRLVSGPRLNCTLSKVDEQYVLTAELSGGGLPGFNWRVDYDNLSEEERKLPQQAAVHQMVEQLAYRIATDLVAIGSPRWRAVRCYTHGLRSYRQTERKKEKSGGLREAECSLIRALNEDQKFTQCHYNLGVVYRQLGELGSAESAFRRALQQQPGHFHACYALAETLVNGKKFCDGLWFCEAAICIAAGDPRPWDLAAYARRYGKQKEHNLETTLPPSDPVWDEVLEMNEIATALAWRDLCKEALRGPSPTLETRKLSAFLCTRNLAVDLTRAGFRYAESLQVFRQAAWLAPHDNTLRLYEGRTLLWNQQWEEAGTALKGVFEDGLEDAEDRGLLWSALAQTEARSDSHGERENAIRLTHNRFLDLAAGANAEELKALLRFGLEKPPGRRFL